MYNVYRMKYWLVFIFIAAVAIFLNAFPNYYANIHTPAGYSYSGQASWFDPWDLNVYVSIIRWGQNGNLLLQNSYTTAPHTAILAYPLYTLIGYLFRGVNPFFLFHLSALVVGILLVLMLWQLALIFGLKPKEAIISLFLTSVGGGLGWAFFPKISSSDLFMTGFTFYSAFQRSHEALGLIFYLASLTWLYLSIHKNKLIFTVLSACALIGTLIFYPYYFLSYMVIAGIYVLFIFLKQKNTRPFINLTLIGITTLPFLLLYYFHSKSSTAFSGLFSLQLASQTPIQILLGYGIITPFLILQLKLHAEKNSIYFLNIWFFTSLLLSFLPLGFARFYLRGLFFPAIILIVSSLITWPISLTYIKRGIILLLLILLPISNIYIFIRRIKEVNESNLWYYLANETVSAFKYLNQNTPDQSGVLTAYQNGNLIPAFTDNRVYFGHFLQTPDAQNKIEKLVRFYSRGMSENEAQTFIKNENIDYVFYGPDEQNITYSAMKNRNLIYSFLTPVFTKGNTIIYRTN